MLFDDLSPMILTPLLFVLGLCVGRFLNLAIVRLPLEDGFWASLRLLVHRMRDCDGCGELRPMWQFLPLAGSLFSSGRCPRCKKRLPRRFALIELLTGGLFAALYYKDVLSINHVVSSISVTQLHLHYAYHLVLICALIVATFIDFDLKIIPDGSTLPAMAVGVLGGFLLPEVHLTSIWWQGLFPMLRELGEQMPEPLQSLMQLRGTPTWVRDYPHLHGFAVSIAGLLVGGGVVWAIRLVGHRALGREAMGFGDVVLMAMIGSFLGWQAALIVFFLAPLCALLVVIVSWLFARDREIPFGPYLSLAALIVLFGWNSIWPQTEQIFGMGVLLPIVAAMMLSGLFLLLLITRGVQQLLGIEPEPEWIEEWTPGDQLAYFTGQEDDPDQGRWHRNHWPGEHSGRGDLYRRHWRRGGML